MRIDNLRELYVEVTNYCLQSCVHCSSCAGPQASEFIPLYNLKKLINEGINLGLECFTISGGEPLLYPKLDELMDYIKLKDLGLNLYTCGVIKSSDGNLGSISEEIVNVLTKNHPDKIIFSLQGGRKETHERVSGIPGSFELTLQSIRRVISGGFNVELHFVPMTINIHDIGNVIGMANSLGISRVSILRLVPQGRVIDNLVVPVNKSDNLYYEIEELRQKYPHISIRLGAPFSCVSMSGNICSAAKNKLLISATGEFYPCEAFKSLKGTRPTLYDTNLAEIWENDVLLNKIRSLAVEGVAKCSSCSYYSLCNGGCPGQRMLANGDISIGPDPWCKLSLR